MGRDIRSGWRPPFSTIVPAKFGDGVPQARDSGCRPVYDDEPHHRAVMAESIPHREAILDSDADAALQAIEQVADWLRVGLTAPEMLQTMRESPGGGWPHMRRHDCTTTPNYRLTHWRQRHISFLHDPTHRRELNLALSSAAKPSVDQY
jgi:hypothetical protein